MLRAKYVIGMCAIIAIGVIYSCLLPGKTDAATGINSELSFEGKIVKSDGTNITDGTYNVEFKIYSGGNATGGGTNVWTEDWLVSAANGVPFTSGTLETNLGAITSLASVNFTTNPL